MKICICGGGSLGLVCAALLASREGVSVNLLTGHPERWSGEISATDPDGKTYRGSLAAISSEAADVIPGSDIILLCLPGFAIKEAIVKIKPFTGKAIVASIVSSTGFFFEAMDLLPGVPLFGFQRVPFIARVEEYGRSARLLGYKRQLAIATVNVADREGLRQKVEDMWGTPTILLDNYLEAALTNSNPILHTGRLYSMFGRSDAPSYDHNVLFYREWTDDSSETIISMDREFSMLLEALGVKRDNLPTLLEYYESADTASLTRKMQSIEAFKDITSPMKQSDSGWIPDLESRYFTEDFPHGLYYIKHLADEHGIDVPTIAKVYDWGTKLLKDSLLRKAQLRMLHILEVVDGICRKENIPYWLDAGTLLGAVRHKGFIPWDDDMDICILKKDYKRFKKAALASLPDDLAYQDWTTDPNHFEMSPRIRDLNSLFDQPESRCQKYRGLFLDVILVERVPNMKVKKFICFFYRRVTREMHNYGKVAYKSKARRILVKAAAYIMWPFVWLMTSIARLHAAIVKSDVMSRYYTHFPAPRCISDIFPCKDIEFEGKMFSGPAHPDRYLEKMFGDYMTPPPESERGGHYCPIELYD